MYSNLQPVAAYTFIAFIFMSFNFLSWLSINFQISYKWRIPSLHEKKRNEKGFQYSGKSDILYIFKVFKSLHKNFYLNNQKLRNLLNWLQWEKFPAQSVFANCDAFETIQRRVLIHQNHRSTSLNPQRVFRFLFKRIDWFTSNFSARSCIYFLFLSLFKRIPPRIRVLMFSKEFFILELKSFFSLFLTSQSILHASLRLRCQCEMFLPFGVEMLRYCFSIKYE